jgi:hypothetical protein
VQSCDAGKEEVNEVFGFNPPFVDTGQHKIVVDFGLGLQLDIWRNSATMLPRYPSFSCNVCAVMAQKQLSACELLCTAVYYANAPISVARKFSTDM